MRHVIAILVLVLGSNALADSYFVKEPRLTGISKDDLDRALRAARDERGSGQLDSTAQERHVWRLAFRVVAWTSSCGRSSRRRRTPALLAASTRDGKQTQAPRSRCALRVCLPNSWNRGLERSGKAERETWACATNGRIIASPQPAV